MRTLARLVLATSLLLSLGFTETPREGALHLALRADDLVAHVETLAAPEYEGRLAGSEGGAKAIDYVVARFQALGLKPKGTKGFRQPFAGKNGAKCENVIGLLEGRDPKRRDEFVVVGAHHDHLGTVEDKLHPGADDNASGVAALLEIARVMKEHASAARSILFITFDSEESGLRGSRYFVENPTVDVKKIVAMINFDMVSRGALGHVCLCGKTESPEFAAIAEEAAPIVGIGVDLTHDLEWRSSSDHGSFARAKIPWLYFGVEDHEDYHKPTDTPDKIEREKIEKIARLGLLTLIGVANTESAPEYVPLPKNPRPPKKKGE